MSLKKRSNRAGHLASESFALSLVLQPLSGFVGIYAGFDNVS
jgi:hypothetical protein